MTSNAATATAHHGLSVCAARTGASASDGPMVRCLVTGSFQPFLEALRGHEVITLQSTPVAEPEPPARGKESH